MGEPVMLMRTWYKDEDIEFLDFINEQLADRGI